MLSDKDIEKVGHVVDRKLDTMIDKMLKVFATKREVEDIVDRKIAPLKEVVQKTYEAVESPVYGKETEKFENTARDAQLSRHDGWIKQVAKETSVKLTTD